MMKWIHAMLAATVAAMLALAVGAVAEEDVVIKKEIKVLTDGDAEAVVLDIHDLEVGEARQVLTDAGKEIVITRTEDGYDILVDGEEIEIGGEGHHMFVHGHGGEEDANHKVIVKHLEIGDAKGYHYVSGDGEAVEIDLDETFEWVHDGTHPSHFLSLGKTGERAAEHLEASGVLDDLDEAKRQEILEALAELDSHAEKKIVVIEVDEEIVTEE